MGITTEPSEKIAGTRYQSLAPEAIVAARRLVLDGLAMVFPTRQPIDHSAPDAAAYSNVADQVRAPTICI